jgi:hypothetical protein
MGMRKGTVPRHRRLPRTPMVLAILKPNGRPLILGINRRQFHNQVAQNYKVDCFRIIARSLFMLVGDHLKALEITVQMRVTFW